MIEFEERFERHNRLLPEILNKIAEPMRDSRDAKGWSSTMVLLESTVAGIIVLLSETEGHGKTLEYHQRLLAMLSAGVANRLTQMHQEKMDS